MFCIVGCQVLLRNLENYFRSRGQENPWWFIYIPSFINVFLIGIFGKIYRAVAFRLAEKENHKYEDSLEDSLVNKFYMFQFVNPYISFMVFTFYHQSFRKLQINLVIVMVFKQVIFNVIEYAGMRCSVSRKISKVDQIFEKRIQEIEDECHGDKKKLKLQLADLRMHREIERQYVMQEPQQCLVFYYNEAVI